jgi:cytosine/adenosine deaminase-related metal-dependent hydrolase
MGTLLVRNATVLATMDDVGTEIKNGGMLIRDGWIEQVNVSSKLPPHADRIVDLSGHVVFPGLINTHHHLYQTLDRACPACQNASLVGWMKSLYPRWERMTPRDVQLATEIGLAELALSGCTTVADHHYLWPNGNVAEDQFEVAGRIGVRFHLGRGFQNISIDQGGFASPSLIEDDDDILGDCERVIGRFHDSSPGALNRVFIAPSSVRSVTPDLLRRSAELARTLKVGFHMHLGETVGEVDFVRERFSCRPAQLAESAGCVGKNTWFAHGIHFDAGDIDILRHNGCGICHCPTSNMLLGSGVAPIQRYRENGLTVGLGVDGAASNDSSNLISEMRLALLLARVNSAPAQSLLNARQVLEVATRGGARLLGRDDIGCLRPGCAADFVAVRLDRLELLGAEDPVVALAACVVTKVDQSWVHGRPLVVDGVVTGVDMENLARRAKSYAQSHIQ